MKKFFSIIILGSLLFGLSAREIDAMKSLARDLLKDVLRSEQKTVIVGGFESNIGRAETRQLEDALQIAMFETGRVEVLDIEDLDEDLEGVDLICTGTISNDGRSAYNTTAKLLDAETNKMVGVALKEIPKSYISDRNDYYEEDDDDDEWAKWFWGAVILHEATRPHHIHVIPEPPRPPRPNRPKPMRPARPKKGVERAERIN
jgi:hypothetical protein